MYVWMLRSLLIFVAFLYLVPQAYTVSQDGKSDALQDLQHGNEYHNVPIIQARTPRGPRPARPARPQKPAKSSKSPGSKPPPKKSPGNPKPKHSKTSESLRAKETSQSLQNKAVVFPKIKVPYIDTATKLCGLWIHCQEDSGSNSRSLIVRDEEVHNLHSLWKRGRSIKVDLPSKQLTLNALGYPVSSKLYTTKSRSQIPVHVFHFKSSKLGSTALEDSSSIPARTTDYATEHIIELQSVAMFMEYAVKKDPGLETFFLNHWDARVPQLASIRNRTPRPAYKLGSKPPRETLGSLIWEALGSTANPTDFVLCENDINSYKARLWSRRNPMASDKFTDALNGAMNGTLNSRVYLSALRTVFAFYHYMNSPTVHRHMQSINANVRTELGHAASLTGQPNVNLVPIWDAFLSNKFTEAEEWGKEWLKLHIEESLRSIEKTRKKYRPLLTNLQKKEKGKGAEQHRKKQHQAQLSFEKMALNFRRKMMQERNRAELLTKRYHALPNPTKADEETFRLKVDAAQEQALQYERRFNGAQRRIHELYSYSLEEILRNLRKDQQRVLAFKQVMPALKLQRP